jgi:hypothetical protein
MPVKKKKAAPRKTVPPKPKPKPMPEKKEEKTEREEKAEKNNEKEPLPVTIVAGGERETVVAHRSDTEQAIIDTYGDDPSKYKEGTREHELVSSLPEHIATKREELKEKEKKDKAKKK